MLFKDSNHSFLTEVAKACDFCLKPMSYSIIYNSDCELDDNEEQIIDLSLVGECRSHDGKRMPENDLEIEIYRSGIDASITISWLSSPLKPILWHGKHSVWMDSKTGSRINAPNESYKIEALARRLRSILCLDE